MFRKLICRVKGHQFKYWHTDKDTSKEKVYRKCQRCGLTQQEVWTGFAEFMWCPVGYTKQDWLDAQ